MIVMLVTPFHKVAKHASTHLVDVVGCPTHQVTSARLCRSRSQMERVLHLVQNWTGKLASPVERTALTIPRVFDSTKVNVLRRFNLMNVLTRKLAVLVKLRQVLLERVLTVNAVGLEMLLILASLEP
jgi:hypothetical protein